MRLEIDPSSRVAIFEQVVRRVKEGIAAGKLKPGDRLPAVRDLAMLLLINPNTVQKAYGLLAAEGLIYSRKGRGMFVAELRPKLNDEERARRVGEFADRLVTEAVLLGFTREDVRRIFEERLEGFMGEG
jgi:GntR family transcriptional regulator